MGKRKRECNLNDIIGGYLKKKNFEQTLKFFKEKVPIKNEKNAEKAGMPKKLRKFTKYSKEEIRLRIAKENEIIEDCHIPYPYYEHYYEQNRPIRVSTNEKRTCYNHKP